jgi:hypothetical protein
LRHSAIWGHWAQVGLLRASAGVEDRQSLQEAGIQAPAAQARAKKLPRPERWQPKGRFLKSCQSMMRTCFHICEQQCGMSSYHPLPLPQPCAENSKPMPLAATDRKRKNGISRNYAVFLSLSSYI